MAAPLAHYRICASRPMLNTSPRGCQDGSHHTGLGTSPNEAVALADAAKSLFESTARMSGEAVVGVLAALHDVSAASLSSVDMQSGTVRWQAFIQTC